MPLVITALPILALEALMYRLLRAHANPPEVGVRIRREDRP